MCRTGVIKGGVYGDLIKIRQILKPQKEKANNATKTESSIQSGIIGRFGKRYAGGWASRGLEQESGEVSNIQNSNFGKLGNNISNIVFVTFKLI